LDKQGLLILDDLHCDVSALIQAAKKKLREHFRVRAVENASALLQEWKDSKIYPYEGDPVDSVERAERQVFDVVAVNINSYLSDFDDSSPTSKRFTFNLVKQALKENPETLQRIFQDVLNLPKDTRMTSPICFKDHAVGDHRLGEVGCEPARFRAWPGNDAVRQGVETAVAGTRSTAPVLAKETWIFGEEFHLTSNEETLNEVLEKYLSKLGKRSDDDEPVTREDGSTGRIDLMLARSVPQPRAEEREHLVVELKRPSRKIDSESLGQVKSYAIAVAQDERFKDTKTRWIFWAISNEMTDEARRESPPTWTPGRAGLRRRRIAHHRLVENVGTASSGVQSTVELLQTATRLRSRPNVGPQLPQEGPREIHPDSGQG